MKVTGIVAEYNPFHTGHQYHIQKAREETEADGIVAIMSGSFVQRGEPAVFDKWTRAFHALCGGVDLVLELPTLYVLSSAEHFARGAVETLRATGVLNALSFGSECGDIEKLYEAAGILESEPPAFQKVLHQSLQSGTSYASARAAALSAVNAQAGTLLSEPNNILAIAYLRALGDGVRAHTVKRVGTGYLEAETDGNFSSALALREKLSRGEDIRAFSPYETEGLPQHRLEQYADLILYALRTTDWKAYETIPNAVKNRLTVGDGLEVVLEKAKTKHITMAAIKRALLQILLKNTILPTAEPAYIRVLGFNQKGAEILKQMKKTAELPVITRPSAFKENCPIWELEKRATDIYFMPMHLSGQDLRRAPVQWNKTAERQK
ncbi:MAG: nucleotidyltransferase family protein [Ruminococcaceae bacterium]|nr:nucleotidyltransferase family protein [Oscillospiraceae bacterium]